VVILDKEEIMTSEAEFEAEYAKIPKVLQAAIYLQYGAKIGTFKGQPVLIPLTPQEFCDLYRKISSEKLSDEELLERSCGMYDHWCSGDCPNDGDINNVGCHAYYDGMTKYCTCYLR
jgi:hypothetical protein